MNIVTAPVNMAEIPAPKQQSKAKTQAADVEFKDMLSGALKPNASTDTESPQSAKKTAHTSKTQTKSAKDTAPKEAVGENDAAPQTKVDDTVAAAAVQAPAESQQQVEIVEEAAQEPYSIQLQAVNAVTIRPQPKVQAEQPETAQPVQTQPIQTQPVQAQPQAAQQVLQPEARPVETDTAGLAPAQAEAAQPQIKTEEQAPIQAAQKPNPDTQAVQPHTIQVETVPATAQVQAVTDTAQTTIEENMGDIVSDEVIQAAETPVARHTQENTHRTAHSGESRTRFDEMLEKAAQELGQGKTVAAVKAEATEPEAPMVENESSGQESAVTETVRAEPEEVDTGTKTPAAVTKNDTAPKFEQRPLKEIPKTDEAVLGMIQPKQSEISVHEIIHSEQPQPAQPVRVPDQAEQIRAQVIESVENDKMEFRMQLQPQELGKVDVKLVLESGKLSVEIMAANSKSTELLSKQAEGLIASLKQSGLDVSSVNVITASENTSGNMDSQYNLNNFQNQQSHGQGNFGANGNPSSQRGTAAESDEQPLEENEAAHGRILNYKV